MAKPFDPEADSIGVSFCENCPHIHLNAQKNGQQISMAMQRITRVEDEQSVN